jgi:hypothetical protein
VITLKKFLEEYGFSDAAIKTLLAKKKYEAPYGIVHIEKNNLVTKLKATGETKIEKMK